MALAATGAAQRRRRSQSPSFVHGGAALHSPRRREPPAGSRRGFSRHKASGKFLGRLAELRGAIQRRLAGETLRVSFAESPLQLDVCLWQGMAMCSLAGMLGEVVTNPLDVVRTRMQLQGEVHSHYKGPLDCLATIWRREGFGALMAGMGPSMVEEAIATSFGWGLTAPALRALHKPGMGPVPPWKRVAVGAACGSVAAVLMHPFDVLRQRSHPARALRRSLPSLAQSPIAAVRSLYRGCRTTVFRSALSLAVTTTTYGAVKAYAAESGLLEEGLPLDAAAGSLTSVALSLVLAPVDLVRARLVTQSPLPDGSFHYRGPLDAVAKIVRAEGPGALFAGASAALLINLPDRVVTYSAVERMRRATRSALAARRRAIWARRAFDHFDADGSGALDESEMLAAFRAALGHPGPAHDRLLRAEVRRIMAAADCDGNGTIDFEEFKAVASRLEGVIARHEQRLAFDALDADGSGALSRGELLAAFRAIAPPSAQNPFLTHAQYEALLRRDVDVMFRRADTNGDGVVSFDEFTRVADDVLEVQRGRVLASWMRSAGVNAVQP